MKSIIYYSKSGCAPCEFFFALFEKRFKSEHYTKLTLSSNNEALEIVKKYNTRHMPFLLINGRSVIHTEDLKTLLGAIYVKNI